MKAKFVTLSALVLAIAACNKSETPAPESATPEAAAVAQPAAADPHAAPAGAAESGKLWHAMITPIPEKIPLNTMFAVDVMVHKLKPDAPMPAVTVDARMPEHNHGMNVKPTLKDVGNDTFRAEPMQFHMPGKWELVVTFSANGVTETTVQSYDIQP